MTDEKHHWAWDAPVEEFFPIGNKKLFYLIDFIRCYPWKDAKGQDIDVHKLIKLVQNNRQYASKIYTVFKPEIDKYIFNQEIKDFNQAQSEKPKENAKKEKKQPKKKPKKAVKEKKDNVINFLDFKNRNTGT